MLARRGETPPARGSPAAPPRNSPSPHPPPLQPRADQPEHPPVRHALPHLGEKAIMIYLTEKVADVELRDKDTALDAPGAKPFHRLRGRPLRPEPVRARTEGRLEDGLQHDLRGLLGHPVADHRYAQRPLAAIWLWDVHAPGRRGAITTCAPGRLKLAQP